MIAIDSPSSRNKQPSPSVSGGPLLQLDSAAFEIRPIEHLLQERPLGAEGTRVR